MGYIVNKLVEKHRNGRMATNDTIFNSSKEKTEMKHRELQSKFDLLEYFFDIILPEKRDALQRLKTQISIIEQDKEFIQRVKKAYRRKDETSLEDYPAKNFVSDSTADHSHELTRGPLNATVPEASSSNAIHSSNASHTIHETKKRPFASIGDSDDLEPILCPRNTGKIDAKSDLEKIHRFKDDLEQDYFSARIDTENEDINDNFPLGSALATLSENLASCIKPSRFKTIAVLQNMDHFYNGTSGIISATDFDKDGEFFATAGVTRKINIYKYEDVIQPLHMSHSNYITRTRHLSGFSPASSYLANSASNSHNNADASLTPRYRLFEAPCKSKISCLSYNSYLKGNLAASDYEGVISLWDMSSAKLVHSFEEHEKRSWSVDCSEVDPLRLASGSDDAKVKIWSMNQRKSTLTIETRANVCSVKFHPTQSQYLAFGSADHHIHYYDIRFSRCPLSIFKGHAKSVSYVKFRNTNELVSASTDSTLRLWSLSNSFDQNQAELNHSSNVLRIFSGHHNEKNFVGLSVNHSGEFIACGSETNEVFTYFNKVSKPILSQKFGGVVEAISGEEMGLEDPGQFVSSVCWKRHSSSILLVSNSKGQIKILEMV